ncbi:hypothetical protein HMPREF0379_1923 [[Eubacterium] yurii subsp. margaretiae ATCC 43715]|nr:hypothetical protein HMPREF0379_1923 [[Eubacterium] yurii subsp. margaretiae ATCC 43715]
MKKLLSAVFAVALVFTSLAVGVDAKAKDLGKKTYSIKNSVQYENPITKEIEDLKLKPKDKQYKSKKAIGDGMSRSIVGKYALLDNTGKKKMLTIKIGMTDSTKDYKVFVKNTKDDKYKEVKFTVAKEDKKKKTKDLKFEVPVNDAYVKISTYVNPMGRNITFFGQMTSKDAKEGSKDFDGQKMTTKSAKSVE